VSAVHVHAVEAVVFDDLHGRLDESVAFSRVRDKVEVVLLRVRIPADRQDDLEVTVRHFQKVKPIGQSAAAVEQRARRTDCLRQP
jgi:hypothetical protein